MKSTTSLYYVEVLEMGRTKRVPDTKKTKWTEFFDRSKAVKFLNELVENNPGNSFRLCKETTTHTEEPWLNTKSQRGLSDKQAEKIKQFQPLS